MVGTPCDPCDPCDPCGGAMRGAGLLGTGDGLLAKDKGLGDARGAYEEGDGQLLDA